MGAKRAEEASRCWEALPKNPSRFPKRKGPDPLFEARGKCSAYQSELIMFYTS